MMGWKIETEVVGPSLRLICQPVCEDLAYPEIFYRDFDEDFSTLDERLQDVSTDLAIGPCDAKIQINDIEIDFVLIMQTCPCDVDPLTPNFYIVKLGFTGVYSFSYFCFKT